MRWIGVDLDGTLTEGFTTPDTIGKPVPAMVDLVKALLAQGIEVRIFTARVNPIRSDDMRGWKPEQQRGMIRAWCKQQFGQELDVTCIKDYECAAIFDDRAITVEHGTGNILTDMTKIDHGGFIPEELLEILASTKKDVP